LRFAPVPQPATLERAGAQVLSSREPQLLAEGMVYLSGEVPRRTPYETGFPGHVRERDDGQGWEPDPLILDERYLSVHVQGKGQIVFSACSHAGIVNVLLHAREVWPELPLHGVVGGLHLSGSTEAVIAPTLADLHRLDLQLVAPGHCTGWRALSAMAAALGQSLVPSAVGKHYVIASS
jgi:7,8-dihydropterin-6-yl-methyl-4-(beta-D-ribofuranosyl)aminobenzene 5'-phosphate synthase